MIEEKNLSGSVPNKPSPSRKIWFLIGILCLSLIAMLAIAISSLSKSQKIYQSLTQNVDKIAENQSVEVTHWLEKIKSDVSTLARSPQFQQMDGDIANTMIAEYANEHKDYEALFLAGTDGKTIASNDGVEHDLSDRAYFQDAMSGKTICSPPLLSRATKHVIIVAAAPILKDNQVVGVVGLVVPIDQNQQALSAAQPGETGDVYLIDSNGMMITNSRFNAQLLEQRVIISQSGLELMVQTYASDQIAAQQSGSGRYKNYLNQPVYGSFHYIPETGWGVVAEQHESEILAKVLPLRIVAIIFFLLSGMNVIGIFIVFVFKVVYPKILLK
jgi:C4-dicarboxylate-specific signal transduction histidine kinase